MRRVFWVTILTVLAFAWGVSQAEARTVVPDTGQSQCYSERGKSRCPSAGSAFFGQDAQYEGARPSYRDNGDGTVTDLVTGLSWSQAVDATKITPEQASEAARGMRLGGYTDWRVPNIKELFSLMDFRGFTGFAHGSYAGTPTTAVPYINTDYFHFRFGNTGSGERYIDGQWLTSTQYVSTTMGGATTMFGVNFADGRIKGYGYKVRGRTHKLFYARYVRGPAYGNNDFVDNGDGTVTDRETGLMWARDDSGRGMEWKDALAYCENLRLGGKSDWRLPNAKELQYIVDYTRSPDTTNSAAIDPVFRSTAIRNEAGLTDWPFYWTSTTHLDGRNPGSNAVYVSFGRAIGQMRGTVMDVHGAGAQRSDPKTGRAAIGHGPQGDAQRVQNYVRCVRGGATLMPAGVSVAASDSYPNNVRENPNIVWDGTGSGPLHPVQMGKTGGAQGGMQRPGMMQGGSQGGMQGPGMMQGQPQGGGMQGPPQGQGMPSPQQGGMPGGGFVTRLDRDGDGKVSRNEWDGPADHFDMFDRNRDGYLSEDEAPKGPPPRGGMRRQ